MAETYVGEAAEFDDNHRKTVRIDERRIVVLRHRGRYYALDATCQHSGGPLEEGMITPRVETSVDDNGVAICDRLSSDVFHIVCPWHGWEFDLATGRFAGDRARRQRSYRTVQRGSAIYLVDQEAV